MDAVLNSHGVTNVKRYDTHTASKFAIATGALMLCEPESGTGGDAPKTMFCAGPLGVSKARLGFRKLAIERSLDVVYLEFQPGQELKGPRNVVVFQHRDGGLRTWANCALWSADSLNAFLIVPKKQNFCFCFDGAALIPLRGSPPRGVLEDGVLLANSQLRAAVGRLTDAMMQEMRIN